MRSQFSRETSVLRSRDAARSSACATLLLMTMALAGCMLRANKQADAPPPPKPAAVQPPAPEQPLSISQTSVTLPDPQEVNPEAIPKAPAVQEVPAPGKTDPPPVPRATRRAATGPPKQEADPEPEAPPPTPAVLEQAPIQPILSGDAVKKIQSAIGDRKKEIADKVSRARAKGRLSTHEQSLVDHIQSFLEQCDQAGLRNDYSQADALSERAVILARELQVE
jgi:hypothetical protein